MRIQGSRAGDQAGCEGRGAERDRTEFEGREIEPDRSVYEFKVAELGQQDVKSG